MNRIRFLTVMLLLAVTLCSCNFIGKMIGDCLFGDLFKEKKPSLPPETQTGENTFGCCVNGELFIPPFGPSSTFGKGCLRATYSRTEHVLDIEAHGKKGYIRLYITNPKEGLNSDFTVICTVGRQAYTSEDVQDRGEVYLTQVDTVYEKTASNAVVQKIVSGTFSDIVLTNESNDSISVTDGRFDILLSIEY